MLVSVVCEKKWAFYKVGIDMSAAFDTIKRETVLNLLQDAGCSEDDMRLVRFLLSNTRLKVRVNNSMSLEFYSTNGSFQGEAASGTLFTLTLAGALNALRVRKDVPRPIIPISDTLMPLESEYADDVNFYDVDKGKLDLMLPIAKDVLEDWCLYMNETKTEEVHFYLAKKGDVDAEGNALIDNEEWRSSKLLGSLLCSVKDINRRIILGNIAFNNFKNVWMQGNKISLKKRLRIYDAQVVSILLYNSGSWAAPKHIFEKINTCHRNHLRSIMNVKWPNKITNTCLYKVTNTKPLTTRIEQSRWKLFGHILRSTENTPASLSLMFAADSSEKKKLPG